ncbi:Adrenodoxin, mitochondrial [Liparis tanakae]|uniref:Adrenodoxin, mitochondrial n=1 Tax=Liparis tanakae TaxID=230148 RepID=A0A4Z2ETJ8_9TELE|nr:Adrenodoxin, mitochondrial [Liparis tanakae]
MLKTQRYFSLHRSRLGCQICLTKSLDGIVAKVPESVADIRQSQDGSS